ncbi:MAG: hypothetical protein DDT19_01762 [Syntrophomonadaceae bacterium]|nr:hypothetical protein [Bacillota bacterium]
MVRKARGSVCGKVFVPPRDTCLRCGEKRGSLSTNGLCPWCGRDAIEANIESLRAKKGGYYEKWARRYHEGMKEYARRLLREEQ